uniref:BZIP domain-containing protein n=1 Tax=Erpetoichthys calabaricus TaxID=27687 RepID=A0A8C4T3C9_ERPCA
HILQQQHTNKKEEEFPEGQLHLHPSPLTHRLTGELDVDIQPCFSHASRRKREFIPDEKKDALYWEKRRKNNEAAKRSREKRRVSDFVMESKLHALNEENVCLRSELLSLKLRFGVISPADYGKHMQSLHLKNSMQSEMDAQYLLDKKANSVCRDDCYMAPSMGSATSCLVRNSTPCVMPKYIAMSHPSSLSLSSSMNRSAFMPTCSFLSKFPNCPWLQYYDPRYPASLQSCFSGRQTHGKVPLDDECEQQVPAAPLLPVLRDNISPGLDLKAALPHKLRLKVRPLCGRSDSDGEVMDRMGHQSTEVVNSLRAEYFFPKTVSGKQWFHTEISIKRPLLHAVAASLPRMCSRLAVFVWLGWQQQRSRSQCIAIWFLPLIIVKWQSSLVNIVSTTISLGTIS